MTIVTIIQGCLFIIAVCKRAAKIRKIAVYCFLTFLLVPELYKGLKKDSFRAEGGPKSCRNL